MNKMDLMDLMDNARTEPSSESIAHRRTYFTA
jgi:hypothetical protein